MLSEKNYQACCKIIESAIKYCNNDLFDFKGQTIDIEYSIEDNQEYNAAAVISTDPYKMIINSGVFEKAFEMLNVLLCEQNKQFYFCVSLTDKYDLSRANIYLDLLFECAVKYIIFHELGHIYNGHVDYCKNNNCINIERQAIEMDADAFSANRCVGQLTYDDSIKKLNKTCPELIKNKEHALLLVIISASVAFAYQNIGKSRHINHSLEQLRNLQYLPQRTRRDCFCRCALNAHKYLNPESKLMLGDIKFDIYFLREVLPNVEQYMNLYMQLIAGETSVTFDSSNNTLEMNKFHLLHCDYLDQYWSQTMRTKLSPYAYFILAK